MFLCFFSFWVYRFLSHFCDFLLQFHVIFKRFSIAGSCWQCAATTWWANIIWIFSASLNFLLIYLTFPSVWIIPHVGLASDLIKDDYFMVSVLWPRSTFTFLPTPTFTFRCIFCAPLQSFPCLSSGLHCLPTVFTLCPFPYSFLLLTWASQVFHLRIQIDLVILFQVNQEFLFQVQSTQWWRSQ